MSKIEMVHPLRSMNVVIKFHGKMCFRFRFFFCLHVEIIAGGGTRRDIKLSLKPKDTSSEEMTKYLHIAISFSSIIYLNKLSSMVFSHLFVQIIVIWHL